MHELAQAEGQQLCSRSFILQHECLLPQAVGVAMARLDRDSEVDESALLLPGSIGHGFRDRASTLKILQELKTDIFEHWDAPGSR